MAVYDDAGEPVTSPRMVTVRLAGPGSPSPAAAVRMATLRYPGTSTFTVAEAGLPVLFTEGATRTWALTNAEGTASVAVSGLGGQPVTASFGPAP